MTPPIVDVPPGVLRALALFLPLAISLALWHARRPGIRLRGAVYLAALWNTVALLMVHLVATHAGWWRFEADGGLWLSMPFDLLVGWVLLWSVVPVLGFDRLPIAWTVAILVGFDLVYMPRLAPVLTLGPGWLAGEALAVAIGLGPALVLARLTAEDRGLPARVAMQVVLFGALVYVLVPAAVIGALGVSASGLLRDWAASGRPLPAVDLQGRIALNLLVVPSAIGLSAVVDFARLGGGTPFPWDPPKRLVTTGLYAYVANPMQIAGAATLLLWGAVLESPMVMLAALNAAIFAAGIAAFSERSDLEGRFGEAWRAYRREVRDWRPRWRPYRPDPGGDGGGSSVGAGASSGPGPGTRTGSGTVEGSGAGAGDRDGDARSGSGPAPARLYVAAPCASCSEVGRWVDGRRPVGLRVVDARDHPSRALRRIAYDPMDGGPEEDGVRAIGRALEHMHLGWAILGAGIRLPIASHLLQAIVDASGGGPRPIERAHLPR